MTGIVISTHREKRKRRVLLVPREAGRKNAPAFSTLPPSMAVGCRERPNTRCLRPLIHYTFGILLALLPAITLAAWFDTTWNYRVPINVPAGASVNSTIKVDVDFNALLTAVGAAGTFDINSPRVVRPNDTVSATQEFTDAVYAGVTDATGNGRGEVRFILQDAGPATYYLYFDITANGPKAVNPQPPINGNFEKGGTGTAIPPSWTAPTKTIAAMDAQIRPSETPTITGIPAGSIDSPKVTAGGPNTGQFSYLLGYRSAATMGAGNPGVTFTKTITVPATSPGTLTVRWRPEGWDSSDNAATTFDFIRIDIQGTATTEIVGPTAGNYVLRPFSPNFTTNSVTATRPGYGQYNGFDCTSNNVHNFGMTIPCESEPWFIQTASLATWAGQTVTLRFRFYSDGANDRTWFHIDDIEWSVVTASLGTPESRVINPGGFNAVDTGIAAFPLAGAVIKTKVAATSFNLDLVALDTAKTAILTTFTGAVKVELLDASPGGVLDTNGCNASWTTIQTLATNPTFVAGDNGRKAVAFTENNAWRNVRVRITFPATGVATAIGCSTDNFAIRPSGLVSVNATDNTWASAGIARGLANSGTNGGNVHKAGQPFTLRATGQNSAGGTTSNYDGSPTVKTLTCTLPTPTCANGTLAPGTWSAASGIVTTTTAAYSEVGSFNLTLEDQNFAAVDSADSTSLERTIPQAAAMAVGRFVPNHFIIATSNTPAFKTFNNTTCAARSFTYIGQPFGYITPPQALVTAQNSANVTTTNYRGNLWKISTTAPSDVTQTYANNPIKPLDTGLIGLPTIASNNDGTGTVTANAADVISFVRNLTTPEAPFVANLSLTVNVVDDSENIANQGIINTTPSGTVFNGGGSGIAFDSGNAFRYGRLKLANAHGSELLNLPIPMETQYWNGTGFITNTADNCTAITPGNILLSNPRKNLVVSETGITVSGGFVNGKSTNLRLNKPGGGDGLYNGSLDICVDLGVDTASATAPVCVAGTPANLPWLQDKWSETNYDDDQVVRGTFGIYRNADQIIYMREIY